MDIAVVSEESLRVKGKLTSFVIDPNASMSKTPGDFAISLIRKKEISSNKVDGMRVIVNGAGEYEVGGVKLVVHAFENDLVIDAVVDGIDILLTNSEGLKKAKEKIKETHVMVVKTDTIVDESSVTAVLPSVVVLYGKQALESAKVLGKQDIKPVSKVSYTLEKLPQEMEVMVLE